MANGSPSMALDDSPVSGHLLPDRVSASALLFPMHGVNTCAKEIWHEPSSSTWPGGPPRDANNVDTQVDVLRQRHFLLRRSEHRR
jgi:hypothetical protein